MQITLGALGGSLVTSLGVYLLAYKRGVTGYRLVLVGIGVTAMLTSVTQYLPTRAEILDAARATVWLTGSLNGRSWDHVRPMAVAMAVLLPAAIALRSEEHTSELQSLMRISYAVFFLKKKQHKSHQPPHQP